MKVERFLATAIHQKTLTMHCIIINTWSSYLPQKVLESDLQKSLEDLNQLKFNHCSCIEYDVFNFGTGK